MKQKILLGLVLVISLAAAEVIGGTQYIMDLVTTPGQYYDMTQEQGQYSLALISTTDAGGYAESSNYKAWIAPTFFWKFAPKPIIQLSPESGSPPLTVTFDASKSFDPDGGTLQYLWEYDGKTNTSETFSDTFTQPGIHPVTLEVTDDEGETGTAESSVKIFWGYGIDLAISPSELVLSKSLLYEGEEIKLNLTAWNLGNTTATDVKVLVTDSGRKVFSESIGDIPKESNKTIQVSWNVEWTGKLEHTVLVTLDPDNAILENDENNNQANRTFYVMPGVKCSIKAEPQTIAYSNCPNEIPNNKLLCPSGDPARCCGPTEASIHAEASNPQFVLTSYSLQGVNANPDVSDDGKKVTYDTTFNSNVEGEFFFTISATSSDGSSCQAKTSVKVTKTGFEGTAPNLKVENIEVVPFPSTGIPSDIYVTITNKGSQPAKQINITYILGKEKEFKIVESLAPGESKRVLLKSHWTPKEPKTYTILVTAYEEGPDVNWADNERTESFGVKVAKLPGQTIPIPEYPGYTLVFALILLGIALYLLQSKQDNRPIS